MFIEDLNSRFYNLTTKQNKTNVSVEYTSKDKASKKVVDKYLSKSLAEYMAIALRKEYKQDESLEAEPEK